MVSTERSTAMRETERDGDRTSRRCRGLNRRRGEWEGRRRERKREGAKERW